MFIRNLIAAALGIAGAAAFAVTDTPSESVTREGDITLVSTPGSTVALTPLGPDIFRISTIPAGTRPAFPKSQSAVLPADYTGISEFTTPEEFIMSSSTTTLKVNRLTGKVMILNAAGDTILSETGGVDNSGPMKSVSFRADGRNYYGAGERGHSLRLNGDTLVMYNRQNYGYTGGDPRISQMGITVPYIASDRGFGILFDDYNAAELIVGDTVFYTSETPKPLSYYFINGEGSLAGTVDGYTRLTGRQPLPPFWSLGYITSKYGYHNEQEALGAVDSLKRAGYPVDGIIFDLYWYGKETDMGRLEWNKNQFPDHRRMLDSLKNMGINTILISQPYINKKGAIDNYNSLAEAGMLTRDSAGKTHDVTTWVGDAGMFDMSNPKTREWLWNRLRPLTAEGLAGWWGDLGEPEVHPLTIVHGNGETASQYHNVYGNEWSRTIYEGLRKDFPEMRPMLLMRGGTAGLQRYSVFPWTTDVSRSWGGLEPQVTLMLNSGLSGLGYMSSDIGGFAVDPKNPTDPELYVRWLELGVFSPVLRTHSQTAPEPYHYPQQEELTRSLIRQRYEWLPYNYTLAFLNASKGYPMARPLNFNGENAGEEYAGLRDEYLWGDEVLVAPVLQKGARTRRVLFPAGEWVNWYNPRLRYAGGRAASVAAPLGRIPLFVKAGSFIPVYPDSIGNVTEYKSDRLTVRYFPSDEESSYTLFDDNRRSPLSLESKDYQLTTFTGIAKGSQITVSLKAEGKYEGMPQDRMITLEIPEAQKPETVSLSGAVGIPELEESESPKAIRQYGWAYDPDRNTLVIRIAWNYAPLTVTIR